MRIFHRVSELGEAVLSGDQVSLRGIKPKGKLEFILGFRYEGGRELSPSLWLRSKSDDSTAITFGVLPRTTKIPRAAITLRALFMFDQDVSDRIDGIIECVVTQLLAPHVNLTVECDPSDPDIIHFTLQLDKTILKKDHPFEDIKGFLTRKAE